MSRQIGNAAEDAAARFLVERGYVLLARNYTIRGAEIDIIARDGDAIVFVEVKYRRTTHYGTPGEHVTLAKRRRICLAAMHWLQAGGQSNAPVRFDVVDVVPGHIRLLQAAFDFVE